MIPLINGTAYDFSQIIVTILGVPVASVSSIEYSEEQLREDLDKIKLEVDKNTESWPNPAKKASDQ